MPIYVHRPLKKLKNNMAVRWYCFVATLWDTSWQLYEHQISREKLRGKIHFKTHQDSLKCQPSPRSNPPVAGEKNVWRPSCKKANISMRRTFVVWKGVKIQALIPGQTRMRVVTLALVWPELASALIDSRALSSTLMRSHRLSCALIDSHRLSSHLNLLKSQLSSTLIFVWPGL